MAADTSSCPSCRKTFRVPLAMRGRKTRCPKCGMRLVVRQKGGRTRLVLAGVSGTDSTSAIPIPVLETLEIEAVPETLIASDIDWSSVSRSNGGNGPFAWINPLGVLLAFAGICGVAAIIVALW